MACRLDADRTANRRPPQTAVGGREGFSGLFPCVLLCSLRVQASVSVSRPKNFHGAVPDSLRTQLMCSPHRVHRWAMLWLLGVRYVWQFTLGASTRLPGGSKRTTAGYRYVDDPARKPMSKPFKSSAWVRGALSVRPPGCWTSFIRQKCPLGQSVRTPTSSHSAGTQHHRVSFEGHSPRMGAPTTTSASPMHKNHVVSHVLCPFRNFGGFRRLVSCIYVASTTSPCSFMCTGPRFLQGCRFCIACPVRVLF